MSWTDSPEGQQALNDRAMDRDFMHDFPEGYCEHCGYLRSTHDQKGDPSLGWTPPWGCPTEALARERWGRE